jgi:hypothetical protein
MRDFLRTMLAFLIVAGTLVAIATGIDFIATWTSGFGLPIKTTFFLFGMAAGLYAKDVGGYIGNFAEAVWQRILKLT